MSSKLVFSKDINTEMYSSIFSQIKDDNKPLYLHLVTCMERSGSVGVREDVLNFFFEHAKEIPQEGKFLYELANCACNPIMTVDHLSLVNEYNKSSMENKLSVEDFSVVFTACVDKNFSIEKIRELLYSGKDVIEIYEAVDQYEALQDKNSSGTISPKEIVYFDDEDEDEYDDELIRCDDLGDPSQRVPISSAKEQSSSDADIFNSLITLMTFHNKDDFSLINEAQNEFSMALKKLSDVSSDISAFSASFMNSMKKDKEEIKRLDAMLKILQKLLGSKQLEISELRGEIESLKDRIRTFESAEHRRDSLNQKISEVYRLAHIADDNGYLPVE